ncbi:MAG: aminodeoxychorismate/anthranilate synthase component II [Solibacterales bacterium]|nr:aminodeoxychorismate/anthranilate synthase component II [Bryobacterales bacterium]|tara:strand:+ start:8001 stop:8564 length:564 start_codon:yes stop_codon:yes gene_type:complete
MVLVIDNYDSFTYNLVQYLGELGATLEIYRNDQITIDQVINRNPDHIVISPGPCTPNEAGISVALIKRMAEHVPILGVCLGHQSIGRAFGGKIVQAPYLMHGKISKIRHDQKTIFSDIEQDFTATRYHSLVVSRESLPAELEVSATTADGVIMGVRHKQYPIEGLQFHPESILTTVGKKLLKNFLAG